MLASFILMGLQLSASVAQAKGKSVAIVFEGADAEGVRQPISAAAARGTTVADASALQGLKGTLSKGLEGAAREKTLARVRKAAAAAGIDGTLVVRVTKSRKERHVLLLLVATSGASGDLEDDVALGPRPSADDESKLASSVGTALIDYRSASGQPAKQGGTTAPPASEAPTPPAKETEAPAPKEKEPEAPAAAPAESPAPEPAGPEEEPEEAPSKWTHPRGVVGTNLVEVQLGAGAMGRHFGYAVNIDPQSTSYSSTNLRPYQVFPAARVAVSGELYPLADSRIPALRNLGLVGSYSRTLFLQSKLDNNAATGAPCGASGLCDTTSTAYVGGLRWRIPVGGAEGPLVGVSLTYAGQSFDFGQLPNADLPSVSYTAVRPAVDVRIPLSKLALFAQAGVRGVLSAGDVALRFRGATTTGVDAGGGVAVAVATGWEVRGSVDYEGYFYSFNTQYVPSSMTGDLYRAKGATDHFFGGSVALAAIF